MATCPSGHSTQATDYCDVCGAPMQADPAVASADAAGLGAGVPSAAPAGGGAQPGAASNACPNCHSANPTGALFCEACGYDFTTGSLPRLSASAPSGATRASVPDPFNLDAPLARRAMPVSDAPAAALPVAEPVEASQVVEPVDASQVAEPVEAAPLAEPVDASQVAEPVEAPRAASEVDHGAEAPLTPSNTGQPVGDPVGVPVVATPSVPESPVAEPVAARQPAEPAEAAISSTSAGSAEPVPPLAEPVVAPQVAEPVEAPAAPVLSTPVPPPPSAVSAPVTTPPVASAAFSDEPLGKASWVAEVWIDPDWYAGQDSPDQLPSPGLPRVVGLRRRASLVGRPSKSRGIAPDVDCEPDTGVSRRHAELSTDGTRWWVDDLGSSNGTYVGQAGSPLPSDPIKGRTELGEDARIYVGSWTRIVVRRANPDEVDL